MAEIYHALGLNMHQPLGNLIALHNSDERWEAKQILWCYDRPTRMLAGYEDVARLHISFSGTLLKQFEDPAIENSLMPRNRVLIQDGFSTKSMREQSLVTSPR
jgi:alpha-amylase/alpha-mannosidase (GH57 family)